MNEKEYTEYIENDEEANRIIETSSLLATITKMLIDKKIITAEEIEKTNRIIKKEIIHKSYKKEDKEKLKEIKTIKDFFNDFAGLKEKE